MIKEIFVAGDHAGFRLKEKLKPFLEKKGYIVTDLGPFKYDSKDDYPDFTFPLSEKVAKNKNSHGIVIAGSGIGEAIAANKVKGIRAILYHGGPSKRLMETSKIHDSSNVLCFGSRFVKEADAKKAITFWLKTKFKGEARHKRRLGKISKYEK